MVLTERRATGLFIIDDVDWLDLSDEFEEAFNEQVVAYDDDLSLTGEVEFYFDTFSAFTAV